VVQTLNRRGRWNLPEIIEEKARDSMERLKKGELKLEPLVDVVYMKNHAEMNDFRGNFRNPPTSEAAIDRNDPAIGDDEGHRRRRHGQSDDEGQSDDSDDNREFKVIQNRKGRKVVEVGARNDHKKERNKTTECNKLKEIFDGEKHYGPVHIYHIYDPSHIPKRPQKTYGNGCGCERCNPKASQESRSHRARDQVLEQI